MKTIPFRYALLLTVLTCWQGKAQNYDTNNAFVQIFAGSGAFGYLDGQGTQAIFRYPSAVVADTSSNLFVADSENYRIRKITPDGTVSPFVGGGAGSLPGYGGSVSLAGYNFGSMVIDHSNTIWILVSNGMLRIGNDGLTENLTFPGMDYVNGLCVDSQNNLYYSDTVGNKIYRLGTNGTLTLLAGSGTAGAVDGTGIFASFTQPRALGADAANNIYVWDHGNSLIRRIDQNRNVTTIAGRIGFASHSDGVGTNATFGFISAMTVDNNGNVILACGSCIRKISAATNVTTIAGSFIQSSYANGVGAIARFNGASGVWLSQGVIYVADRSNQRIRQIAFDPTPQQVSGANLGLDTYAGLKITGFVGRAYRIESSTDLSDWNIETTLLLTSSPYLWIDPKALGQKKTYRAFLLP